MPSALSRRASWTTAQAADGFPPIRRPPPLLALTACCAAWPTAVAVVAKPRLGSSRARIAPIGDALAGRASSSSTSATSPTRCRRSSRASASASS